MLVLHVAVSLAGIACGFIVLAGLASGRDFRVMTHIFLAATFLTDATGLFLPKAGLSDPPTIVGVISLILLLLAAVGYYVFQLSCRWRSIYIAGVGSSLCLNCFVAVIQAFQKISILHALAPTGSERPFIAAQAGTILLCAALGTLAVRRFHRRSS